jgi:hypothetical protein
MSQAVYSSELIWLDQSTPTINFAFEVHFSNFKLATATFAIIIAEELILSCFICSYYACYLAFLVSLKDYFLLNSCFYSY